MEVKMYNCNMPFEEHFYNIKNKRVFFGKKFIITDSQILYDNGNKLYLNIPYNEKDEIKKFSGRFCSDSKLWTIPFDYISKEYIPVIHDNIINVFSKTFDVLEMERKCWRCNEHTKFFVLSVNDDNYTSLLSIVSFLSKDFLSILSEKITHKLKSDFSKALGKSYIMNHCLLCDAKLGDRENNIFEKYCYNEFQAHHMKYPIFAKALLIKHLKYLER